MSTVFCRFLLVVKGSGIFMALTAVKNDYFRALNVTNGLSLFRIE
jgi:hypothetical protein